MACNIYYNEIAQNHISLVEIVKMQRLYRIYGTYTAVAREMGRSASSVSTYVQMKDVPTNIRIAVENLAQKGLVESAR